MAWPKGEVYGLSFPGETLFFMEVPAPPPRFQMKFGNEGSFGLGQTQSACEPREAADGEAFVEAAPRNFYERFMKGENVKAG